MLRFPLCDSLTALLAGFALGLAAASVCAQGPEYIGGPSALGARAAVHCRGGFSAAEGSEAGWRSACSGECAGTGSGSTVAYDVSASRRRALLDLGPGEHHLPGANSFSFALRRAKQLSQFGGVQNVDGGDPVYGTAAEPVGPVQHRFHFRHGIGGRARAE